MFYTYIWRTADGMPFYVGKGSGKRAHETAGRSVEFNAIRSQGGCTVEIVDEFILESQAHAHEMELIERYGRRDLGFGPLVNMTDGGDGTSGWVPSTETRARISAAKSGKPLSPEARARIGAARIGAKHSPETRAKISASQKGRIISPEHRASLSAAHSNRSQEYRDKLSAASTGKTHDPETRSKMRASHRMLPPRSGFKGVSFNESRAKWRAELQDNGKRVHLGRFSSPRDAARAYDAAAYAAWGDGCYLNFPVNDNELPMAA